LPDSNARESESRGLSIAEQQLLRWLLTRGAELTGVAAPRAAAFLPQPGFLRVIGGCSCGCPTIYLDCEEEALLSLETATETLADVVGRSPEGIAMGMILRAKEGRITQLEAYGHGDFESFSLPTAEQLVEFR
jgi:hypothetical protein